MAADDDKLEDEIREAYRRDLPGEELDRAVMDRLEEEGGGEHEISAAPGSRWVRTLLTAALAAAMGFVLMHLVVQGFFAPLGDEGLAKDAEWADVIGRVRTSRGKAVAGADVVGVVKTWPGGRYRHQAFGAKTDAKGKFTLPKHVPVGAKYGLALAVIADGFAFESVYALRNRGGKLDPIDLKLKPAHPVTLEFVSADGSPISGVEAFPTSRKTPKDAEHIVYAVAADPIRRTSDENGEIRLACFAKGDRAEVSVKFPDRESESREFTVTGAKDEVVTLRGEKADDDRHAGSDVADIPSERLTAGGDEEKPYFRVGPMAGEKAPAKGFGLLLILPGGGGDAAFAPFVKRIYKHAVGRDFLVAQPLARKWTDGQAIVWPTEKNKVRGMKFSTEEFIAAVVTDAAKRRKIDPKRVFAMGWSSSGPALYAASLTKGTPVKGWFVAMSVFKKNTLPSLRAAAGTPFYILHSKDDATCPYRMAETARDQLKKAGAKIEFATYSGGHGWRGDVYGMIRAGLGWLGKNAK